MRRCLLLILAVLLACRAEAAAATFPRIPPGISCTAQTVMDGKTVEVELRLLNNNVFFLQTVARQGKSIVMRSDVSGSWRQTGDGAGLLLDNPYGFHRRADIGSRGAIYLDMSPWSGAPAALFVLRQEALRMTPVRLMGVLHADADGRPLLRESGSQREFAVEGLPAGLAADPPLFVELAATPRHDSLVVDSVRAQSARLPSGLDARRDFADVCGDGPWLLEQESPSRPISCTFHAQGPDKGRVELAAAGLHAQARYVVDSRDAIRFVLTEETRRMLELLEETAVLRLLDAASWKTVGNSLAFRAPDGETVFLVPGTARLSPRANLIPHGVEP